MDKITWCFRKKGGIRLVEPSQNLATAYLSKAEDAMASMRINLFRDWKITTAYYTIYFSLYAVLMRVGIRCEIHSCTLAVVRYCLADYFTPENLAFFEDALEARIDAQYYVGRDIPDERCQQMMDKAPEILVSCILIIERLTEKKIQEIRARLAKSIPRSHHGPSLGRLKR